MQQFNIELDAPSTPLVLYAMQADSLSRFFQMTITQGGTPWTPPTGTIWTVRFGAPNMPSGWYDTIEEVGGSTHPAVVVSDNVAVVEIAEQAVSMAGQNILCVLVTDATGYQIASWQFQLLVTAVPGYDAPEVTTYYNLLTEQVAQVLASQTAAAESATLAQSWAVGNTGTRDGENTNNAQYWSQQAAQSAQEAVGFRTMQGGAVLPADGDIDLTQPYPTKTGGSLTVASAENRIESMTVNGFTTQAGSGTPSYTNIRKINNAGEFNALITITGSESGWYQYTDPGNGVVTYVCPGIANGWVSANALNGLCSEYKVQNVTSVTQVLRGPTSANPAGTIIIRDDSVSTLQKFKEKMAQIKPVVAYLSTESLGKFYTGISVEQGDNYHCTIVELKDRLHKGDALQTSVNHNGELKCIENHIKHTYVFTGDESCTKHTDESGLVTYIYSGIAPGWTEENALNATCSAYEVGYLGKSKIVMRGPTSANPAGTIIIRNDTIASAEELNAQHAALFNAGTPVVVEYDLASPEIYANTPFIVDNPQGTYTVSGESGTTCQGFMEPLQNGGDAATLNGNTWADIPVQSVNGKTGAVQLSAVDVGAISGNMYSTSEVLTGAQWVDGSPIYAQTVATGALPDNAIKTVQLSASNINTIVKIYGFASSGNTTIPLPYYSVDGDTYGVQVSVASNAVSIKTGGDRSSYSGYITVEYTKTGG